MSQFKNERELLSHIANLLHDFNNGQPITDEEVTEVTANIGMIPKAQAAMQKQIKALRKDKAAEIAAAVYPDATEIYIAEDQVFLDEAVDRAEKKMSKAQEVRNAAAKAKAKMKAKKGTTIAPQSILIPDPPRKAKAKIPSAAPKAPAYLNEKQLEVLQKYIGQVIEKRKEGYGWDDLLAPIVKKSPDYVTHGTLYKLAKYQISKGA